MNATHTPLRRLALTLTLATLGLAPRLASAQVEARCPAGWDAGGVGQPMPGLRPVRACRQGPQELVVLQYGAPVRPDQETELATQVLAGVGMPAPEAGFTFRAETVAGHPSRVAEFSQEAQTRTGQTAQVTGMVLFVPVGDSTVVFRGTAITAQGAPPMPAGAPALGVVARALVPTLVGLDGRAPAWRASAQCPEGMSPRPSESMPSNGTRRVVLCQAAEEAGELEVLESRLPVRTPVEARAVAMEHFAPLIRRLGSMGAQTEASEPQAVTWGALHGFVVTLRISVNDPRAPAGSPGAALQLTSLVAVLPTTTGGNVQMISMARGADLAGLTNTMRTFATTRLRLDGAGVPSAVALADAGAPVAAVAASVDAGLPAEAPAAPRRRREVDLSIPLWQPPPEDLIRHDAAVREGGAGASSAARNCGCSTPGAPARAPGVLLGFVGVLALLARRRRSCRLRAERRPRAAA